MAVHMAGEGPPVLLVHGFPELAFSWRHQLPALAAAGYRAIAPDMRGYGGSDKPEGVHEYTIQKLIGDLVGLMDALGIDRPLLVGHDWGALVTWQMALLRAERMAGLVALNIPFFRRPPIDPILWMRLKLGKEFYIVDFQRSDEADRRFAEDPARFIDVMMRKRRVNRNRPSGKRQPLSLLRMLSRDEPGGEVLLTPAELRYYADALPRAASPARSTGTETGRTTGKARAAWRRPSGCRRCSSVPVMTPSSRRVRSKLCGLTLATWKFA